MQIIINIHEKDYQSILNSGQIPYGIVYAIMNGTPLPHGHGELVDRDAVNERYDAIYRDAMNCSNRPSDKYLLDMWSMCLDTAPTIIADEESEEA